MYNQDDILGFKVEPSRIKLIPMLGSSKRVEFTAIYADEFKNKEDTLVSRRKGGIGQYTRLPKHNKRYKGQEYALLKCLHSENGDKIAEHVWILFSKKMKDLQLERGDKIKFKAKVYKYAKSASCDANKLQEHWSIRSIVDIEKIGNVYKTS